MDLIERTANALLSRTPLLAGIWVLGSGAALVQSVGRGESVLVPIVLVSLGYGVLGFGVMWVLRAWYVVIETISRRLVGRGWSNVFVPASAVLAAVALLFPEFGGATGDIPANRLAWFFIGTGVAAQQIAVVVRRQASQSPSLFG